MEGDKFSRYIMPEGKIDKQASNITGIRTHCGKMFVHGHHVETVSISAALFEFSEWLQSLNNNILLVAHNAKVFDAQHLSRSICEHGFMSKFTMVIGFSDTLLLFRKCYPELKGKCSLSKLHEHFIGSSFNAHNAMDDVDALKSIMEQCKITITELGRFSFTLSWAIQFLSCQQVQDAACNSASTDAGRNF